MKRVAGVLVLLAALCPSAASAWSPEPATFGEGVTRDVKIKMRDGVELSADVYYPTRANGTAAPGPFPILVSETPYGKEAANVDGLNPLAGHRPYLVKRGYIQALVDVRGQGGSNGSFQLFGPDERADSREVIKWASKLPHGDGKVGMTGESYLGIVQMFAAADAGAGSPLKAIFPIDAANDPYKDLLVSGGLLNIESSMPLIGVYGVLPIASPGFQAVFDPGALTTYGRLFPDRVKDLTEGFSAPTITDLLAGGDRAYEGAFWGASRRPDDALAKIVANKIPAYLVGGLYDVFQRGEPLSYAGLQNAWAGRPVHGPMSPTQKVTGRYQLLMKPQYHLQYPQLVDTGPPNLDEVQLAWFDRWLKGKATGIDQTTTPLHVVEPDGVRRDTARFPLAQASVHAFYLGAAGALTDEPPKGAGADTLAFTGASLPCDRSTEQWSLGGLELAFRLAGFGDPCAGQDLVPASVGPGQLVYSTPPFASDEVLAGPLAATLYATSTTTDTEWIAKVSDVAPDGTSTDLTQGALLGSHRALDDARTWRGANGLPILPYHPDSLASKVPVKPGEVTRYDIEIRSTFATLAKGHRLRLTLLSSQTPHLLAIPEDLANLTGGIYAVQRSAAAPSSMQVPLVDPADFAAHPVCRAPHAYVKHHTLKRSASGFSVTGRALVPCGARTVRRVSVSVARRVGKRCSFLTAGGRFGPARACSSAVLLRARGTRPWSFRAAVRLRRGTYVLNVRATDSTGEREATPKKPSLVFHVR
jgi:uncharacterized protein